MFWARFFSALLGDFGRVAEDESPSVRIEYFDPGSGSWKYAGSAVGTPSINLKMRDVKGSYPDRRVRAVSRDGSVVDILT